MSHRYYSSVPITGDTVVLAEPESRHIVRVMRAKLGDNVVVFDGSGAEFRGEIADIHRGCVTVAVKDRLEVNREAERALTVAAALPKGDRQRQLVEKCTELGVTRLIPLETERGVAQPTAQAVERLRRAVIEASKQCGRNRLMQIDSSARIDELLRLTDRGVMADPSGSGFSDLDHSAVGLVAVGPEGGFTDRELTQARDRNWAIVSLGPRILRVETAAIYMAAALLMR